MVLAVLALPVAGVSQSPERFQVAGAANLVGQWTDVDDVRSEVIGSVDVFADIPLGPAVLHVYAEGGTTPKRAGVSTRIPSVNTDAGTALGPTGRGPSSGSPFRWAPVEPGTAASWISPDSWT